MSRVEEALARLDRAIARLEQALEHPVTMPTPVDGGEPADGQELRDALEAVRTDYTALQEITDTVRTRLDATIERLETILER